MLPPTSDRLRDPATVPYFLWDTGMTVGEAHTVLASRGRNRTRTALGHRVFEDLDLFCASREDIGVVVRAVVASAEAAGAKDGGMDPAWFAWALGPITIRPLPGLVAALDPGALERFRDRLQQGVLALALLRGDGGARRGLGGAECARGKFFLDRARQRFAAQKVFFPHAVSAG